MGSYRSDDEALIGLARQLTDAYGEARTREDQDYACESIDEFLSEFKRSAPSEALIAFLGLPLTAETYPLVDETQMALAARGPAVVELLLRAVLGDVYDPAGPASERAAETIDELPRGEASLGLTEVLCGRGDGQLKGAAVDGLVALGGLAEPDLVAALDDPRGGDWAQAALEQIRYGREHPGAGGDELDAGEDEEAGDEEAGDDEAVDDQDAEAADDDFANAGDDGDEADDDDDSAGDDGVSAGEGGAWEPDAEAAGEGDAGEGDASGEAAPDPSGPPYEPAGTDQPTPAPEHPATAAPGLLPSAGPDLDLVDDAYEDFLRRFEQEAGGEAPSP